MSINGFYFRYMVIWSQCQVPVFVCSLSKVTQIKADLEMSKRSHIEIDPDYEDVTDQQAKRQRVIEEDAKEATIRKIHSIVKAQFDVEIYNKEAEITMVDQRLHQTRSMMDRLRACIVANYYSSASQQGLSKNKITSSQPPSIHPAVKKHLGKSPVGHFSIEQQNVLIKQESSSQEITPVSSNRQEPVGVSIEPVLTSKPKDVSTRNVETLTGVLEERRGSSRFKIKKRIIVGNISKYIPVERRESNDQSTHKWMVYVRGSKDEPKIDNFVKKVWFFLHPSYRPNDLVEISQPPFHLTRRGWGEFPIRIQLHFRDSRNKRVDIIHQLRLDKTCTGLQTLGAETVVDIELERDAERSESPDLRLALPTYSGAMETSKQSETETEKLKYTAKNQRIDNSLEGNDFKHVCIKQKESETGTEPLSHIKQKPPDCVLDKNSHGGTVAVNGCEKTGKLLVETEKKCKKNCMHESNVGSVTDEQNLGIKIKREPVLDDYDQTESQNKDLSQNGFSYKNTQETSKAITSSTKSSAPEIGSIKQEPRMEMEHHNVSPLSDCHIKPSFSLPSCEKTTKPQMLYVKCRDAHGNLILIPRTIGENISHINMATKSSHSHVGEKTSLIGETSSHIDNTKFSPKKVRDKSSLFVMSKSLTDISRNQPMSLSSNSSSLVTFASSVAQSERKSLSVFSSLSSQKTGSNSANSSVVLRVTPQGLKAIPTTDYSENEPLVKTSEIGQKSKDKKNSNADKISQSFVGGAVSQQILTVKNSGVTNSKSLLLKSVLPQNINVQSGNSAVTGQAKPLVSSGLKLTGRTNSTGVIRNSIGDIGSNTGNITGATGRMFSSLQLKGPSTSDCSKPGETKNVSGGAGFQQGSNVSSAMTQKTSPSQPMMIANIGDKTYVLRVLPNQGSKGNQLMLVPTEAHTQSGNLANHNTVSSLSASQHLNTANVKSLLVKSDANMSSSLVLKSTNQQSSVLGKNKLSNENVEFFKRSPNQKMTAWNPYEQMHPVEEIPEKKILVWKSKKPKGIEVSEEILSLTLEDYPDLLSVIRESVRRHPVVKLGADRSVHPYCAGTVDEWLMWNVGKRRSSEWQRASSVKQFIQRHLGKCSEFKGEQLWTTKQIMTWCRLHAFSPHYLEGSWTSPEDGGQVSKTLEPGTRLSSLSDPSSLVTRITQLGPATSGSEDVESDVEIDIVSIDMPKMKIKEEAPGPLAIKDPICLTTSEQAMFVQDIALQVGVKFEPTEIEEDVVGSLSEDLIYSAMTRFAENVLREAFAHQAGTERRTNTITSLDVYKALCNMSATDFLTNKHLGIQGDNNVSGIR